MRYELPRPNPNPTAFEIQPLYGMEPSAAKAMLHRMCWGFEDAEYYIFVYAPADSLDVQRFLPPPLRWIRGSPLSAIFIQQLELNGGRANGSLNAGYLELIVGAMASYKGTAGFYPISIMIESDIGAMLGREGFGTAKKVARIAYERTGDTFFWRVSRRGIVIAEASGAFVAGDIDPANITRFISLPSYHLHQVPGTLFTDQPYAYPPRLMEMRPGMRKIRRAQACDDVKLVFHESPFDPICLLAPKAVHAVTYFNADTLIHKVSVLEELDAESTMPFLFAKWDPF